MNQREFEQVVAAGFSGYHLCKVDGGYAAYLLGGFNVDGRQHTMVHRELDAVYDEILELIKLVVPRKRVFSNELLIERPPIRKLYATKVAKKSPLQLEDLSFEQLEQLIALRAKEKSNG